MGGRRSTGSRHESGSNGEGLGLYKRRILTRPGGTHERVAGRQFLWTWRKVCPTQPTMEKGVPVSESRGVWCGFPPVIASASKGGVLIFPWLKALRTKYTLGQRLFWRLLACCGGRAVVATSCRRLRQP